MIAPNVSTANRATKLPQKIAMAAMMGVGGNYRAFRVEPNCAFWRAVLNVKTVDTPRGICVKEKGRYHTHKLSAEK